MKGTPAPAHRAPRSAPWGGAEDALEVGGQARVPLFEQGEDATAVVVGHDDRQVVGVPLPRPEQQAGHVVQERQVAQQRDGPPRRRQRDPDRGGDRAVDPRRPAVGVHRHIRIERAHERQVPHGIGGTHHEVVPGPDAAGHGTRHVQSRRRTGLEMPVQQPVHGGAGTGVGAGRGLGPLGVHAPTR
ncbi:hypothetical protein BFG51_16220 [Dietzia alimentaria]|nr:hypothetical protein BFG51_16220 [Dietzia alimentaria]